MTDLIGPYFLTVKDKSEAHALALAISDKRRNGVACERYSGFDDAYIIQWMPRGKYRGNMTVRVDGSVWDHGTNKLVKASVLP